MSLHTYIHRDKVSLELAIITNLSRVLIVRDVSDAPRPKLLDQVKFMT
jgi:hypothetical protein